MFRSQSPIGKSNRPSKESINVVDYFPEIFDQPVPAGFSEGEIADFNLRLDPISCAIEQETLIRICKYLLEDQRESGREYLQKWEQGWAGNREAFEADSNISSLIPKYISKNKIFRFGGDFFSSPNPLFEADFARLIVAHYVFKYLSGVKTLVDLGSGSCHYTYWLAERFSEKLVLALDSAEESIKIADLIGEKLGNVKGIKFDMFQPRPLELRTSTGLITVGALEQIGKNFLPLVDWIRSSGFETVIHLEPLLEFYDPSNLVDYLSIEYLRKRNWLRGYLPYLDEQARRGEIEILEKKRIFGSSFHETYHALVWRFR